MVSLIFLVLATLCIALPLTSTSMDEEVLRKRWQQAEQGISADAMLINWIGLGFLPDFDSESVSDINAALPLPAAVIGDYLPISPGDYSLGGFQYHISDIIAQSTKPVYMATIEPDSLYDFDSNQADAISTQMAALNAQGVPVWVRFAYEMNGCPAWNAWGCDPAGFKAAWAIMAASLRANAPDSKLLWSPNVDTSDPPNYDQYYPGDDTVDLVGLSLYSFGEDQQENTMPGEGLFIQLAQPFYESFSAPNGKPFVLAETSAAYHYYTGTEVAAAGGSSELSIKSQWLGEILGWQAHYTFPNLIASVWFNYEKDERDQTIDYRALFGNSEVQSAVYALKNW